MLRTTITSAILVVLGAGAIAQNTAPLHPVPGVKHAGTYHLATKTWTRGGPDTLRGTYDVIYDNTCLSGWHTPLGHRTFHDDGRIPSTSSPQVDQGALGSGSYTQTSLVGTKDVYGVNGFEVGYCTGIVGTVDVLEVFYECFTACSDATLLTPTASFVLSGFPGSATAGNTACWTVSVDLVGTTQVFALQGDCDGAFDGSPAQDYFGYGFMVLTPDPTGLSGPMITGDPDGLLMAGPGGTGCCVGCGTTFFAGANVPGTNPEGSGLNSQDFFEMEDYHGGSTFTYNGCYWYGGYSASAPHAGCYLEILGDALGPDPGTAYCFGHTSQGNICPCGNDNDQSDLNGAGCANGLFTAGARLYATGVASLMNDTLAFYGTRGLPNDSSMFFQAANNLDGTGNFLGDGIRCAGGNLKKLVVRRNNAGGNAHTVGTSISVRSAALGYAIQAGDTLRYQWWYRDNTNPPCGLGLNDSNTSNGYEVTWLP